MKKRTLALVLAVVLLAAMSTAVFAVDQTNLTITVNSDYSGRSYSAYQIFAGTVESNTDGDAAGNGNSRVLSDITWGTGVNSTGILNDVIALTGPSAAVITVAQTAAEITLTSATTASDFAKVLAKISDADTLIEISKIFNTNKGTAAEHTSGSAAGTGPYTYNITGLNAGYYIVIDTTNPLGPDEAASAILLNVVGNTSITEKVSIPSVDKSVENASGTYDTTSADHAINEPFSFKLTAALPADTDYAAYDAYLLTFTDTPSAGVTYESITSVTVTGKASDDSAVSVTVPVYNATTAPAGYKVSGALAAGNVDGDGTKTLVVTIDDLKTTAPTLDLTKGAAVTVIYTAHLNASAEVEPVDAAAQTTANANTVQLTYSNNPTTGGTGNTTTDIVYVFTFEVDNNKWAGPGTEVTDPTSVAVTGTTDTLATTALTSWVDSVNNFFYQKTNGKWYKMSALAGAGFTLYSDAGKTTPIKLISNGDGTYTVADQSATAGYVTEMTSAATTGKFDIKGLDAGTYYLAETTTPAGYNTADDTTITITAVYDTTATPVTVTTTTSTNDDNEIVDNSGTVLPSTGGIGTTIFYIVGGILVLGAGVVLLARKRAGTEG